MYVTKLLIKGTKALNFGLVHLVDDDDQVRRTVSRLLASAGYVVREYSSGSAFLKALPHAETGFVLLDIRMPEKDGLEVQRELNKFKRHFPVIFMTGSEDQSVQAYKAGALEYMNKPFGRTDLIAVLNKAAGSLGVGLN